ncbi:hypothetical protein RRSWK_02686 [Rhodopirellula sp. SWK7]|nr:hypothetical protein RRSWK_02686 [Rhodopirellula sp. SWK7]
MKLLSLPISQRFAGSTRLEIEKCETESAACIAKTASGRYTFPQ